MSDVEETTKDAKKKMNLSPLDYGAYKDRFESYSVGLISFYCMID